MTRVDVIERRGNVWRYSLEPVSGRKHQLRVQMAGLGAAIRNDGYYPDLSPQVGEDFSRPLQLLAQALSFSDPLGGGERYFESRRCLGPAG